MNDPPAERGVAAWWDSLSRRKVVQWGVAYTGGAWGLLQALQFLSETYAWPSRVLKPSTLGFLIGTPLALVLAWYHGDRGEQRIRGSEVAIILLLFLTAGGVFWRYEPASDAPTNSAAAATTLDGTA